MGRWKLGHTAVLCVCMFDWTRRGMGMDFVLYCSGLKIIVDGGAGWKRGKGRDG